MGAFDSQDTSGPDPAWVDWSVHSEEDARALTIASKFLSNVDTYDSFVSLLLADRPKRHDLLQRSMTTLLAPDSDHLLTACLCRNAWQYQELHRIAHNLACAQQLVEALAERVRPKEEQPSAFCRRRRRTDVQAPPGSTPVVDEVSERLLNLRHLW